MILAVGRLRVHCEGRCGVADTLKYSLLHMCLHSQRQSQRPTCLHADFQSACELLVTGCTGDSPLELEVARSRIPRSRAHLSLPSTCPISSHCHSLRFAGLFVNKFPHGETNVSADFSGNGRTSGATPLPLPTSSKYLSPPFGRWILTERRSQCTSDCFLL